MRRGHGRRRWWWWVVPTIVVLICPLARADDVADEAEVLFAIGAERYRSGDYRGALEHFLASNRLVKNRNVAFNVARSYEQLKQYPEAHRYYSRALEGETDEADVTRTREALARVAPFVAVLNIMTEPPGARIYLQRKELGDRGVSPQSLAVAPGRYAVIAELPGWEDAFQENIQAKLGLSRTVTLVLKRIVGRIRVAGPAGALVRLDREEDAGACTAPCELMVAPGPHVIFLERPGFRPAKVSVAVEARRDIVVHPELTPDVGAISINADERDAVIELDGSAQAIAPAVLTASVGRHTVRVLLHGYRPYVREVVVEANAHTKIEAHLETLESVEAASRMEESVRDAPASVSVLRGQELRAMRYPTVFEALRGTRGVFVSDDRGYASLGVRGFGRLGDYGNRVLVTIDGAPYNDDWVGGSYVGFDLRSDLEDIDRIEVVRGPGAVLYGTSAVSGVVNLITRGREMPPGREVALSAAADGVARARGKLALSLGQNAGVWMSASAGRASGREYFVPEFAAEGPRDVAGHSRGLDSAEFGTLTGRAWWKTLSLHWSLHHHGKQLPVGQFMATFGDERARQQDTRGYVEGRFETKLGAFSFLTRLHGNVYAYRGILPRRLDLGGLETTRYDSVWAGLEQRIVFAPSEDLRVGVGGEIQAHVGARQEVSNEARGTVLEDERAFQIAAVYANADLRIARPLKLSVGARVDHASTFGASINPRAAVLVRPYTRGNVKFMVGKSFRAPSLYELFYASTGVVSNSGLEPEDAYNAEIEFSHSWSETTLLTLDVFSTYMTRLITLSNAESALPGQSLLQYRNTSTPVGVLGAEAELKREWKEGWMAGASYSYQQASYLAGTWTDLWTHHRAADLREVPNSPRHMASLRGAVPLLARALTLMTRVSWVGPRFDRHARLSDPDQTETPSEFLWDAVLSGGESRVGLQYSIGVYNALDCRVGLPVSSEFRQTTVPMMGRSLLLHLAVTF
jgi:outer membrane receptor protein involved in Fe transport